MQIYPEVLIRTIFGMSRKNIHPLSYAVHITAERLFVQHISIDELLFTKDIYPTAARLLDKKPVNVTRRIERLANHCQDKLLADGLVEKYIGKPADDLGDPHNLIIYLAVYAYLGEPFYKALQLYPELFAHQADLPSLP
ncbi:hypothetical protein D3Z52_21620 [Clostridiaceae bacterium]|nr:hypothetical protein [Clostridiaceae bacterium]